MKTYVKKVWSYNPKLLKAMELGLAIQSYEAYVKNCVKLGYETKFKSFKVWLSTEI